MSSPSATHPQAASSPEGARIIDAVRPEVQAAAAPFRKIDLRDLRAAEAVLESPLLELRSIVYNPLTCLLTATNAFNAPATPTTAIALESLADMDAVTAAHRDGPRRLPDLSGYYRTPT
jgi:hypothetical protein